MKKFSRAARLTGWLALIGTMACSPRAETADTSGALLPAIDTLEPATNPLPDPAVQKAPTSTGAGAAAGQTKVQAPPTSPSTSVDTPVLGRDRVITGPLRRRPTIADTSKRPPSK